MSRYVDRTELAKTFKVLTGKNITWDHLTCLKKLPDVKHKIKDI